MTSRDIVRDSADRGPYRRPTTERIRNWLFAIAFGVGMAWLQAQGF